MCWEQIMILYIKINGVNVFDSRLTKDKIILDKLYRVYNENNDLIGLGRKNNNGFKVWIV